MGDKSTAYAVDILELIFQALPIPDLARDAASPTAFLYIGLHFAAPATNFQDSNEATYTSYARVAVARTTGGWDVSAGGVATPDAQISFPAATGGSDSIEFFSVGTEATGTTALLYSGPVLPIIAVSNGVTPVLTVATSITEE